MSQSISPQLTQRTEEHRPTTSNSTLIEAEHWVLITSGFPEPMLHNIAPKSYFNCSVSPLLVRRQAVCGLSECPVCNMQTFLKCHGAFGKVEHKDVALTMLESEDMRPLKKSALPRLREHIAKPQPSCLCPRLYSMEHFARQDSCTAMHRKLHCRHTMTPTARK